MNTYCGPFALGFVCGRDSDWAERVVQRFRCNDVKVRTMYGVEMNDLLTLHAARAVQVYREPGRPTHKRVHELYPSGGFVKNRRDFFFGRRVGKDLRPTLAAWLRTRKKDATYVVLITGHFLVVKGNRIYDNAMRDGVLLKRYRWRRSRVRRVWEVTCQEAVTRQRNL